MAIGSVEDYEPLPKVGRRLNPLGAIEDAVRPALLRPPCIVSFSGGRDSSAVLAVAARLARSEGHPLPVPVTMRFQDVDEADEAEWQELVIRHLGLPHWEKLQLTDELDLLGPISTAVLRRHGVLWPPNAFAHMVILQKSVGGSVVTGIDGDAVFGSWRYAPLSQLRHGQVRPRRGHLRLGAAAVTPRSIRRRLLRRPVVTETTWVTWLRPSANRRFVEMHVADQAGEPVSWRRRVAWLAGRRSLRMAVSSLDLLGADTGTRVFHPLIDRRFLSSLGGWGGRTGPGDRTRVMTKLFGGLLPTAIVTRRTKATFDGAFWRADAQAFVRCWDGAGVDPTIVDTDQLRRVWSDPTPTSLTALLAQQVWLATTGGKGHLGTLPPSRVG